MTRKEFIKFSIMMVLGVNLFVGALIVLAILCVMFTDWTLQPYIDWKTIRLIVAVANSGTLMLMVLSVLSKDVILYKE